jgi:diguanylate cyclase (GGDEF)-like protein
MLIGQERRSLMQSAISASLCRVTPLAQAAIVLLWSSGATTATPVSGTSLDPRTLHSRAATSEAALADALSLPPPLALIVLTALCGLIALVMTGAEVLRRTRQQHRPEPDKSAPRLSTHLTESIAVLDDQARVIDANDRFRSETGLPLDQIRGRHIWALHRQGFGKSFWDAVLDEARTEGRWSGESRSLGHGNRAESEDFSVTAQISGRNAPTFEFRSQRQVRPDTSPAPNAELRDALTALPNRRAIKTLVEMAIVRAASSGQGLALILVDLDRFRDINSVFGDDMGDRVLEHLAEALHTVARPGITVGRLGGDEFILVVEQVATTEVLSHVASELLHALGDELSVDGLTCRLSASLGVAQYPKDGKSQRDLMQAAGVSLCHAKAKGRGQVCFFSDNMEQRSEESLQMEADLRRAIAAGELMMFYQPQIDLRTGQCIGAEALLRWQHPVKGLLLPGGFVPLALDTGLTTAIDRFVVGEVCAQFGQWHRAGLAPMNLSINLSATSLLAPDFGSDLCALADRHQVDLARLEIEVLESTMFPRMRSSLNLIDELRRLGIRLAIDDFGTGYSSLAMLKELPVDRIKLDRRFIKSLPQNFKDDRIVAAVVAMGRSLDMTVIAEGVETQAQKDRLIALGCTQAQGYLFGRPIPADEFAARWMKYLAPASFVGVAN